VVTDILCKWRYDVALTAKQVEEIRSQRPTERGTVERKAHAIAKQFGVSHRTITKIWRGKKYTGSQGPRKLPDGAKKTMWKKGQTGNPKGRPEWSIVLSKAYKKQLAKQYGSKDHTWADEIAAKVAKLAVKGNIKAATELADRSEGRPTIYSQVMGPGGIPLYPQQQAQPPDLVFQFVSVKEIHGETQTALPRHAHSIQAINAPRTTEESERQTEGLLEGEPTQ
jgi:hypothetical protein